MARKHGHGSIYRRSSDGRIVGRLPDGRGGHRYVSRPDVPGAREEVRRELDAMRRERDRMARSSGTVRGGERLRDLVAVYLATVAPQRVRARTLEGYRQIARDHVLPTLGTIRVAQLDAADAQLLVERMTAAGHAPTTVRNAVVLLSAVLRQAMRDGIVDRNVASLAVLPKPRQQTLPSLSTDQVAGFLEATRGERFWPVWTLAATTGMRISRVTVDVTLAHYHQKVCTERAAEMETRIAELEAEVRRLRATPARVVVIDHRRVADGGKRKRQQLREARR